MHHLLLTQYSYIKQSREVLLAYCATFSNANFLIENSSFGRGSIRNLLVHIANTYEFWIGKWALQRDTPFTPYESIATVSELQKLYLEIDSLMAAFFETFEGKEEGPIIVQIGGKETQTTPLKLFTHVITHEFHHKGQVLSFSRHLGYTPVDTDVMR